MDKSTVARELAEEIRVNTALRHRLGMDEGCDSGVVDDNSDTVALTTKDGDTFFLEVQE